MSTFAPSLKAPMIKQLSHGNNIVMDKEAEYSLEDTKTDLYIVDPESYPAFIWNR